VIKSRTMRWWGHVARMGEMRNAYKTLIGKPKEKRQVGRPRRRWEDNIRNDLREIRLEFVDWVNLAQDSDRWWVLMNTVMNLRYPQNMRNFFTE